LINKDFGYQNVEWPNIENGERIVAFIILILKNWLDNALSI